MAPATLVRPCTSFLSFRPRYPLVVKVSVKINPHAIIARPGEKYGLGQEKSQSYLQRDNNGRCAAWIFAKLRRHNRCNPKYYSKACDTLIENTGKSHHEGYSLSKKTNK